MVCAVIALLAQLNAVDRLITEGNRLQSDQLFPEADSVYGEAIRKAQAWGSETHFVALAANNRGAVRYRAGQYADALTDYQNAHRIWLQLGRAGDAAKAATNLAELYHARGDDAAALRWSELALTTGDTSVAALTIHGNTLRSVGRLPESLKVLNAAVARESGGRNKLLSLPLAYALLGRAQTQLSLGLLDEADQSATWAKEILVTFRGPDSLAVSRVLLQQAHIARLRGDANQAERWLREVLRVQQQGLPDGHPQMAPTMVELAELLAARQRFAEAEKLAQRAAVLVRQGLGESHPDYAGLLLSMADLYRGQRKFDDAERYYRDAITHARTAGIETQARFASYLNNYAALLVDQDRFSEAEPLFRQALAHRERFLGAAHFQNAELLFNLAVVTMAGRRWTEAEALVERSLALKQQVVGNEHASLTPSLKLYGQLLLRNGKKKRAQDVARLYAKIEAGQPGRAVNWQSLRSFR
ncbi:MAG: tetratricopeptide repeat protein [Acidobacteria bacterium]|nr:tetratricopeptide repeat protein [Acidobacteriota bacterium]